MPLLETNKKRKKRKKIKKPLTEIDTWNEHFGYALREENRTLFNRMLSECQDEEQYSKAVNTKGENYSTESLLFMTLIF